MSDERRQQADPGGEAGERLVRIRALQDEASGTMLADFLREQGIEATVMPVQIAWMPGVETMTHGYWGQLEVLERDAARARALIEDFYAARPEGDPALLDEEEAPTGEGDPEGAA
ncbi:MAG TPA: hypothetical protein VF363_05235 [Candidatus Eisenbacteria bacterium]